MDFKEALVKAAKESHADGAITDAELLSVSDAANGNRLKALEAFTEHRVHSRGADPNAKVAAIDWGNLVAAIREFMPLILQIVALFQKPVAMLLVWLTLLVGSSVAGESFVVTEKAPIQCAPSGACGPTYTAYRYNNGGYRGGRRGLFRGLCRGCR